jgi:hypothetical protein
MEAEMNRTFLIGLAAIALTATGAQACNYQHQASANAIPDASVAAGGTDSAQLADPRDLAIGDVSIVNHLTTD